MLFTNQNAPAWFILPVLLLALVLSLVSLWQGLPAWRILSQLWTEGALLDSVPITGNWCRSCARAVQPRSRLHCARCWMWKIRRSSLIPDYLTVKINK